MSQSAVSVARCCTRTLHTSPRPTPRASLAITQCQRRAPARRRESTAAASSSTNPKISTIVDQISQLTLLETADLVSNLKLRLNIPDMPLAGFSAGPAAPAAAAAPVEEEEAAPVAQEKTLFALTFKSFDAGAKPKVIKEIKSILGLSLVDSKKFVESAPKQMKDSVAKEECEKIIETMKGLGAVVTMD
ncbi:hypothetical protein ABVK25_003740 [Lepraria finkii]|uniref:Uncharacterized protein n=1 Tax=Lepraria finkii TaxID=1340010 RepID=A0ABR4BE20_9LECA